MKKLIITPVITLMLVALSIGSLFVGTTLVIAIYLARILRLREPQETLDRCVLFSQNATKKLETIWKNVLAED